MQETRRDGLPGVGLLVLWLVLLLADIAGFVVLIAMESLLLVLPLIIFFALKIGVFGFFKVAPNEGKVLQLFGAYRGTARKPGLRYTNPFYSKARISLRVRNFETGRVKVNDRRGNPIEIAAVVVWKVVDTAEATFQVDDYENYVHVQSEAAVRNLATGYAYDAHEEEEVSLVTHTAEVSDQLKTEIQERLAQAGVEVHGGESQPPGVCAGNRRRHAASPAGRRRNRGPPEDRGRGRGYGRKRAGHACRTRSH